jgi:hypothetical protein
MVVPTAIEEDQRLQVQGDARRRHETLPLNHIIGGRHVRVAAIKRLTGFQCLHNAPLSLVRTRCRNRKRMYFFAVLDCGLRVVNFILCRGGFGWIVSASERVTYLAPHGYLDHTAIVVDYSLGDRDQQGGSPSNSAAIAGRKGRAAGGMMVGHLSAESYAPSSLSSALASFRSSVLNPSVNQPYNGARSSRASTSLP